LCKAEESQSLQYGERYSAGFFAPFSTHVLKTALGLAKKIVNRGWEISAGEAGFRAAPREVQSGKEPMNRS
jgi:hypothetical protein